MTGPVAEQRLLERLLHLSRRNQYDVFTRFVWPSEIERDRPWCDEDLLTTFGTQIHEALRESALISLSHWECINFFSLNVHGIKGALAFLMMAFYEPRYRDISEYLHVFVAEENGHMWFFAKFCLDYVGKIYPAAALPTGSAANLVERDLLLFASTLIFEEYVDFYNYKVSKSPNVPAIVREINHQHHLDESRHISFGREIVQRLYAQVLEQDASQATVDRVRKAIEKTFVYFIGQMYNPRVYADAQVIALSGMQNAAALRNRLRNDPSRRAFHQLWFKRTADFFVKHGILLDTACLSA